MQRDADLLNLDLFAGWSNPYRFRRMYMFFAVFLAEQKRIIKN